VIKAVLIALVLLVTAAIVGFGLAAWRPEIAPVEPPTAGSFDAGLVQTGSHLAMIGNCITCHTSEKGATLAGGVAIATPFGTIHSTNITPDPETGIGRWSEEAFQRAMHEGVDRQGRHLYPAFPYDHFTLLRADDNRALYAFLMTRTPVRAPSLRNDLRFPFNMRVLIAGWKLLYLDRGSFEPNSKASAEWNRGAYLVEGLSHCGACHTPRNGLGAERKTEAYSGGYAEGWYAYAINAASPAPILWDEQSLFFYLRRGWHELHGVSRGPMAPVTANLSLVPEENVQAIATYVASLMGAPGKERKQRAEALVKEIRDALPEGVSASADSQAVPIIKAGDNSAAAVVYAGACAICHESGRPLPHGGLHLKLSTGIHSPDARNVVNVVLDGLPPSEGERSPLMPGFRGILDEQDLVALIQYLRSRFSDAPAWSNLEQIVRERLASQSLEPAQ
jgi:mono/diheme cytochrome c family protein